MEIKKNKLKNQKGRQKKKKKEGYWIKGGLHT